MFHLAWQQHGGSGLAMTWQDALDLDLSERDWLLQRIREQRRAEAREIEKAAKRT